MIFCALVRAIATLVAEGGVCLPKGQIPKNAQTGANLRCSIDSYGYTIPPAPTQVGLTLRIK